MKPGVAMSSKMSVPRFTASFLILVTWCSLSTLGTAQNADKAEHDATPTLLSTRTLPAKYPVITVRGECPKASAKAGKTASCDMVVTRKEFEELIDAINPRMPKYERRDLAKNYGQMLALSQEALRKGLDKDPGVQALIRYVRTTALGGAAYKQVQRASSEGSEQGVDKYYATNKSKFDRFDFERIFIPAEKQGQAASLEDVVKNEAAMASTEAEMKQLAEKIHARAAAGEDFAMLQKEAAAQAGINHEVSIKLDDMLRGTLPAGHKQAFDLAQGAVSSLISDSSGYYIYKLVSKNTPALDSIRSQVELTMQNDKMSKVLDKIKERSTVNQSYFDKYDPPAPNPNEPEVDDD
jgi:hypothetical protein